MGRRSKGIIVILFFLSIVILFGMNYYLHKDILYFLKPNIGKDIDRINVMSDMDGDGLNDLDDILEGALLEVSNRTKYKSAYYAGGYPPDDEGVCTDVIWRALDHAGYNIKDTIDEDIKKYPQDYPRVKKGDPNIDFRRVVNLYVFMEKGMEKHTIEVIPYDVKNLVQWQPGDIVILEKGSHIAMISDKRRKDGVPYVVHNAFSHATEEDTLMNWVEAGKIIGHYRFRYNE